MDIERTVGFEQHFENALSWIRFQHFKRVAKVVGTKGPCSINRLRPPPSSGSRDAATHYYGYPKAK